MDGYGPATYGDRFAEVYDDWYDGITDAVATVTRVVELVATAGGGPVVELGVGTGRLALPLAGAGLSVVGVDASTAMLERLRAKPGGGAVSVVTGDLADLPDLGPGVEGEAAVVLLAFNTLFNLVTDEAQLACLRRSAELLAPAGSLLVEAFVPADDVASTGTRLEPRHVGLDEVVLTVSDVGADGRTIFGQHIHLRESGTRLRSWRVRLSSPAQLDQIAAAAGLRLVDRWASWEGDPFVPESAVHVSRYVLAMSPSASGTAASVDDVTTGDEGGT